jgi:hypothetical protein
MIRGFSGEASCFNVRCDGSRSTSRPRYLPRIDSHAHHIPINGINFCLEKIFVFPAARQLRRAKISHRVADLEQALRTTQRSSDHTTHMASVRDWCSLLVFCRALKPAYGDIKDCVREAIVTRHWVTAAILLVAAGLTGTQALAQDYPTRPVTMIIPFAAGGR